MMEIILSSREESRLNAPCSTALVRAFDVDTASVDSSVTRALTAKRDYLRAVEKRLHSFFGNRPLELSVGGFIGRKKLIPNDRRVRGIDDLERPLVFMLQPDDRDLHGDALACNLPRKARIDDIGVPLAH